VCHCRCALPPLGVLLLCAALSGCGKTQERCVVTGLVTLNDQPLSGATVKFVPTKPEVETPAAVFGAVTDSSGRYRAAGRPGAFKIVVLKWERKDGAAIDPNQDDSIQEEWQAEADPNSPYRTAIPTTYTLPNQTPFSSTVEDGVTTIDLPLKTDSARK
jgi:hypothetical protein